MRWYSLKTYLMLCAIERLGGWVSASDILDELELHGETQARERHVAGGGSITHRLDNLVKAGLISKRKIKQKSNAARGYIVRWKIRSAGKKYITAKQAILCSLWGIQTIP